MSGSSGPSGLDASMWKHLSTSFNSSDDLCSALASLARRISTTYVDPSGLYPFLASRLIAIDKLPGVCPIGIGEVVRRIVGKAVLSVLRDDILEATGTDQLCAGQPGGCEGAVHAVRNIFDSVECEAVLFVDASNAFNSLNRNLALINITNLCPSLSTILINCYRLEVPLSIDGEIMLSAEGTTQGDPLAMAMYAIGILPLIRLLNKYTVSQVWYADDAAALGQLKELHKWWVELVSAGFDYGYFVNPSKSWLLVKPSVLDRARLVFGDTSINLTTNGFKYLGSPIGSVEFVNDCICATVSEWAIQLESLSSIAQTQPHAAYSVLTHGLLNKFTYLFRTTPNVSEFLAPLETIIRCKLIPTLSGQAGINDTTRSILSVPARLGGLAITNPITESVQQYNDSVFILEPLVNAIIDSSSSNVETISSIISDITSRKSQVKQSHKEHLDTIISNLRDSITDTSLLRCLEAASESGASSWLTALPIKEHGFALHKGAFRDALCLRYGWTPPHLSSNCVCGSSMSIEHALNCKCGGFPSLRHNELRDITADLLTEICPDVQIEPTLQPLSGESFSYASANTDNNARADIAVSSFWSSRQRSYLDVRVFNPFSNSYNKSSIIACHRRNEKEKRRQYEERICNIEHGSFTPLVFTTAGGMGPSASTFYKYLSSRLSIRYSKSYSKILNWIRCRLSFSLLRSSIMCLRGARSSYHHPCHSFRSHEQALSDGRVY